MDGLACFRLVRDDLAESVCATDFITCAVFRLVALDLSLTWRYLDEAAC